MPFFFKECFRTARIFYSISTWFHVIPQIRSYSNRNRPVIDQLQCLESVVAKITVTVFISLSFHCELRWLYFAPTYKVTYVVAVDLIKALTFKNTSWPMSRYRRHSNLGTSITASIIKSITFNNASLKCLNCGSNTKVLTFCCRWITKPLFEYCKIN